MQINDFYPGKGFFSPEEIINLKLEVSGPAARDLILQATIFHLEEVVDRLTFTQSHPGGYETFDLQWIAPPDSPRGYGIMVDLLNSSGQLVDSSSTAFDVLADWTTFPRYGFLTDFTPGRDNVQATIDELIRFHINGLQFYDWQYRHDQLLPPDREYIDPLDRSLSLDTVQEFIDAAHDANLAAMPYLAVYAASIPFWLEHPEWALYDKEGQPTAFLDFLGLMDPTAGRGWINHLLDQCRQVLGELPFDGLHVDQYGDPKIGWAVDGSEVDIPAAFSAFIHTLKEVHPQAAVLFNAVGNWPIEALARAPQDFNYIEIWPPDVHYDDIRRIVSEARSLSGGKPVVIALYLPADQGENVRLADALIFALGGSRIEIGEAGRLLCDPYFPKHQAIGDELRRTLRRYYDFAIRYGELIGPAAKDEPGRKVDSKPGVWAISRRTPERLAINLINMTGQGDPRWDQPLSMPESQSNLKLRIECPEEIRRIWWASPDHEQLQAESLDYGRIGTELTVNLPNLDCWALVTIELAPEIRQQST